MANKTPIAVSRFGISIDGVQIASFSELQGITTKTSARSSSRELLGHELTHLVQQNLGKRDVAVRLRNLIGADVIPQLKLKGALNKHAKLTAYNKSGSPMLAISGILKKIDTDVMKQEWSITYETIQRVL